MQRKPSSLPAILILTLVVVIPCLADRPEHDTPGILAAVGQDGTVTDLPLRQTNVSIEIAGFVARTTVEQVFVNPFDHPIEAVYTFPLGHEAAVDEFELRSGDRVIRGEVHRREEAREIYEAARSEGRQAALIEQERPNVFTQSVANLVPAGEVRVRLRTVEVLDYDSGVCQMTFPLVVGPRYVPGDRLEAEAVAHGEAGADLDADADAELDTDAEELDEEPEGPISPQSHPATNVGRVNPAALLPGQRSGHDVDIRVVLDAGVPFTDLTSVSHEVEIERDGPQRVRVTLSPADRIPNKDFILRWSVASDEPAVGVLAHRDGVDGYFAFIVQPRASVEREQAAPKEVLFVLDTSGSMSGAPLRLSRVFLHEALRSLGSRDTFNLIRFASGSSTFSDRSLDGNEDNVAAALRWVDALKGEGGTEVLQGLERAIAQGFDTGNYRMIVFLSDGYIGNESEVLARIEALPDDLRIFTVGIGSSVNHSLLDGMARLGRGAYTFIPNDQDADASLARFTGWVTRPYLTNLEIDWGALPVGDWIPEIPHDLFSGQNLTVIGRYFGAAEGSVVVRGRLGGRYWETEVPITLPETEPRNGALASIWARGRIQALLDRSPDDVGSDTREEVIGLALEHQLMSPYTSFVAVDYRIVNPGGESETVLQSVPLPDGTSFDDAVSSAGRLLLVPLGEELTERVTVVATSDVVDLERSATATRFSDNFVADLPVPGRYYQDVLMMAPGVQDANGDGNPNVHGARSRDFRAIVSGLSDVDALVGRWSGNVNPDSIEEIEVITAGASVQFGQAQGGYARIVQKQGNNQHEGLFRVEGACAALDAAGGTDLPLSYASVTGGLQVTGPLERDGLWYRASHRWADLSAPVRVGESYLDLPQRSASHSDALTWQVSPRNKLQFSAQWQNDDIERVGASSLVRAEATPGITQEERVLSLRWIAPYSAKILIETTVSRRDSAFERGPVGHPFANGCLAPEDRLGSAECLDLVLGAQRGTTYRTIADDRLRYGLDSKATIYAGRFGGMSHQLELGVLVGQERYDRSLRRAPNLIRLPRDAADIVLARTSAVEGSAALAEAASWALFVEDQVKPAPRLTLTLGLRLDAERVRGPGFSPFDPRQELEHFLVDTDGLTGTERADLAGATFTGPEDLPAFLEGVSARVGNGRCCAAPTIGPERIASPRSPRPFVLEDRNLSPFFSVKWDPWGTGRAAFSATSRRYYDRLHPTYVLVEAEPAIADILVATAAAAAPATVRPSIQLVDRGLRTPYQDEWTVRFEREISVETQLSASLVHRSFAHQIQQIERNHRPGDFGRCVAGQPVIMAEDRDGRLDDCDGDGQLDLFVQNPLWGDVFLLGNFGSGTYRGFTLAVDRRQYRSWEMRASYTLSEARGTAEAFDSLLGDERTMLENRNGFQSDDQRHAFKLDATCVTRWGIRFGGSMTWQSGLAYSMLEQRIVHDAVPPALTGLVDSVPTPRLTYATSTRNSSRNASLLDVNVRIAKDVSMGSGVILRWSVDVLNALGDRSYRIDPLEREYGRSIDGFDDARWRSGRRYQVGLQIVY